MKKVLSLVLVCLMVAALMAGCGSSDTTDPTEAPAADVASDAPADVSSDGSEDEPSDSSVVYSIGIVQQLEHPALDSATEGFMDACKSLFGEENVVFDLQNGQGEQTNCATICNSFVAADVDLILANATTALQCAAAATNSIPILGTSITDYATALDIADWTGATGSNISGTSDLAPIAEQEAMLKELFPDVQKVGILYCSAEPNSAYQAKLFADALEANGIAYSEYTAADSNEIQSVVTAAIAECDVLYIPTDNTLASNTEIINNICQPAGVPIIAGEEGICKGCGVATLSINYYDIGYRAGEMAYDILVNGADVSTMEIEFASNVTKEYNASICEALNIAVPEDYTAIEMD